MGNKKQKLNDQDGDISLKYNVLRHSITGEGSLKF